MSVVKAALRAVHGEQTVQEKVSGYYLANEVTRTQDGMMIAIPQAELSQIVGGERGENFCILGGVKPCL